MNLTPLSDKITALVSTSTPSLVNEFEKNFINSQLGLVMHNRPVGGPGEKIIIDGSGKTTISLVSDPEGNPMIKACADPDQFEKKYNEGINSLMSGREILEMLINMPEVEGVLVCSASSFNSFPIYRSRANILLEEKHVSENKWWKFW